MESWLVQYRQLIMLLLRQSGSGIDCTFFPVSAAPSLSSREIQIHSVCYGCCSSFSEIHAVDIFVLLKFENKLDIGINHFNLNLKYLDKYKFAMHLIQLLTASNSFPLEIVQKWQCYKLCVLQENSIQGGKLFVLYITVCDSNTPHTRTSLCEI